MKPKITIGHFPIIDHLVLGVAEKNDGDFYQNFSLKTKPYYNWENMTADLKAGKIDGAFLLFPLALDMFAKGKKIKIILLGQREGQALVVNPKINSLAELKGQTVLLPHKYSSHHILFWQICHQAGLDAKKDFNLKFGLPDIREIPETLRQGLVQAFVAAEPWNSIAEEQGFGKILTLSHEVDSHHVCCVFAARQQLVENSPNICQELVDSLVRAGMFINAYPRQAAEIGEVFLSSPRHILLKALTHHRSHILFWDLLPRLEDFEELQNIAVENMHLWTEKMNLKKLIESSFAQTAYREWTLSTRKETKDKGSLRSLPGNFYDSYIKFQSFFPSKISLCGLKYIFSGDKYPATKEEQTIADKDYLSFLDQAINGNEITILSPSSKLKAVAIINPQSNLEPDKILIKLNRTAASIVLSALTFGNILNLKDEDNLTPKDLIVSIDKKIVFFKNANTTWLSIDLTIFKLLTLLLNNYK